jgi:putative membrane protein
VVLAAIVGLALTNEAFAQNAKRDQAGGANAGAGAGQAERQDQAGQQRQGQAGQAGKERQGQAGQQGAADPQETINRLMAEIAKDPDTAADKLFILTAALHNQAELELARKVMKVSKNDQVRQMAQQIIQEREKATQQLQQVAKAVGLELPEELAQAAVAEIEIVAALPADQLDQQYAARQQAANARDMSSYHSAAELARNPQVKKLASDQVPMIERRGQRADATARAVGVRGPEGSGEAQPAAERQQGERQQKEQQRQPQQ